MTFEIYLQHNIRRQISLVEKKIFKIQRLVVDFIGFIFMYLPHVDKIRNYEVIL